MKASVHAGRCVGYTFEIFHLEVSIFICTVPSPVASSACASPRVTSWAFLKLRNVANLFLLLHIWHVAPESTIQLLLELAERAWNATRASQSLLSLFSSCFRDEALFTLCLSFSFVPGFSFFSLSAASFLQFRLKCPGLPQ